MYNKKYFNITSAEMVSAGHVDSMADTISDSILDEALNKDKESRVAVETVIKGNNVIIVGEITTSAEIDYETIVKTVFKERKLPVEDLKVQTLVSEQSLEINQGVDKVEGDTGAGDQGIVFGYATNETPLYLNMEYYLSYKLSKELEALYKESDYFLSDYKVQIGVKRDKKDNFLNVEYVLVSVSHTEDISLHEVRSLITKMVKHLLIEEEVGYEGVEILINPNGAWTVAHGEADTGLTGRKIVADSYGRQKVGGGALSGKDYTKVDRSGAYFSRYLAKTLVFNGLVDEVLIELSYAIGVNDPVGVKIDVLKENSSYKGITQEEIVELLIKNGIDFSVSGMIRELELKNHKYKPTALNGHYTNEEFNWEKPKLLVLED